MRKYLRYYLALIKFNLRLKAAYNFNFWLGFGARLVYTVIQVAMFQVIFLHVQSINGWNFQQLVFLTGTFMLIDAIDMTVFFFGVISIPEKIRNGGLDLYLVRPGNPKILASIEVFDVESLPVVIPALLLLGWSSWSLGLELTFAKIAGYLLLVLLMVMLVYAIVISVRSISFWVVKVDFLDSLEEQLFHFAQKIPGTVYKGAVKILMYTVLPFGIIATIPAQFFTAAIGFEHWALVLGVVAAHYALSCWLWRRGLRRYSSASS